MRHIHVQTIISPEILVSSRELGKNDLEMAAMVKRLGGCMFRGWAVVTRAMRPIPVRQLLKVLTRPAPGVLIR